jgi:hypothetical protein
MLGIRPPGSTSISQDSRSPARRGLTYPQRFVRHYRHRRQAGYSVGHAICSTRARMRHLDA